MSTESKPTKDCDTQHSSANGQICWLEIPVRDPSRATAFYTAVLGWSCQGTMSHSAPQFKALHFFACPPANLNGAFVELADDVAVPQYVEDGTESTERVKRMVGIMPSFNVKDLEAVLGLVVENGGRVDTPKTKITGEGLEIDMGYYAVFEDTEGNLLNLWSQN